MSYNTISIQEWNYKLVLWTAQSLSVISYREIVSVYF